MGYFQLNLLPKTLRNCLHAGFEGPFCNDDVGLRENGVTANQSGNDMSLERKAVGGRVAVHQAKQIFATNGHPGFHGLHPHVIHPILK